MNRKSHQGASTSCGHTGTHPRTARCKVAAPLWGPFTCLVVGCCQKYLPLPAIQKIELGHPHDCWFTLYGIPVLSQPKAKLSTTMPRKGTEAAPPFSHGPALLGELLKVSDAWEAERAPLTHQIEANSGRCWIPTLSEYTASPPPISALRIKLNQTLEDAA